MYLNQAHVSFVIVLEMCALDGVLYEPFSLGNEGGVWCI